MLREKVDIIVHIPLEAEYLQFREIFPVIEEFPDALNLMARVKAPSGLRVVVIVQEAMGRTAASNACHKVLSRFEPKIYVCLGIAGGLSKDLSLGDVCYSGTLIDVSDNSKVTDSKDGGGLALSLSPQFHQTDRRLTAAVGFVRTLTSLIPLRGYWEEKQTAYAQSEVPEPVVGRGEQREVVSKPKSLNGEIVCGLVSESDTYRDLLKGVTRNILAVETESGPVFEVCSGKGIEAITIRGISDYANAGKGKLEGDTKDAVRRVAARNAAAFLHMQMQSEVFLDAIRLVSGTPAREPELALGNAAKSDLPGWLTKVGEEIDVKLRELSPQFRTKPRGFKLPAPRVKRVLSAAVSDSRERPVAIEFQQAIAGHRRMVIYIPRTYPDQALAWVLAHSLLDAELAGKKLLPVVIEGKKLGPPKDGFRHLASIPLNERVEIEGGEYVFIIDEPPFHSKTRSHFINSEIKLWNDSRVIFLTRKDRNFVEGSEFTRLLSADPFSLCDVSFAEMAAFIESSFALPGHEADVVALKLRGMFQRFALPAHPSFFAGIPSDALAALLQANRRSELIQLAVDGFLSFVVAADRDEVRMSRTHRAKFLRRLAVETVLEKRRFTEADLVAYARSVSEEFDYGLDPIRFVQSFVDSGLIFFEDGLATITLPFIESYLFADEIAKHPDLARRYLEAATDDIDLSIFDLYAEIGPSAETVDRLIIGLQEAIDDLPVLNEPHVLFGDSINPVVFRNPARLRNLSAKVSEARKALSEGANHRDEKARILDIADRVSEDVAERSQNEGDKSPEEEDVLREKVFTLTKRWTAATILLGSGAESIIGQSRQSLAEMVIRGAATLLDVIIRQVNGLNFETVKADIVADGDFKRELGVRDDREFESVVSALVDLLEFMALTEPMDRVFDGLPDRASHRIVGNSVEKAKTNSNAEELIRLNWLANIHPQKGKGDLLREIHSLPRVQFLRASLTSIFMMRAKWKVPEIETRMALLDAAEEAIRPYNPKLDKGEIMRFVSKHVPGKDDADEADTVSDL